MPARKRRGCFGIPCALLLPFLYLAFAVYGWVDFTRTNHDGLANLGLFLITAPVTLVLTIGSGLAGADFPMPEGHGYLGDHALYYVPAVLVTAVVVWWLGKALDRLLEKAFGEDPEGGL